MYKTTRNPVDIKLEIISISLESTKKFKVTNLVQIVKYNYSGITDINPINYD